MITTSMQTISNRRMGTAGFLFGVMLVISLFSCLSKAGAATSGPPVKVMTQVPLSSSLFNFPSVQAMALAMEKSINARGGIGGRPLKVIICDNKLLPTGSAACARRAVSERVVATILGFNNNPEQSYPIYATKKIPVFLPYDLGASDYTNRLSYPSIASIVSNVLGMAVRAGKAGCKNPNLVISEGAAPELFLGLAEAGYAAGGGKGKVASTVVPQTAIDMSTYLGAATSKSDCLQFALPDVQVGGFVKAYIQQGKTQKLFGDDVTFTQEMIRQNGGASSPLNGRLFLTSNRPAPANKAWAEYNKIVKSYVKNKGAIADKPTAAMDTYLAYGTFYEIFKNAKNLTPASVRAKLDSLAKVPTVAGIAVPSKYSWKRPFSVGGKVLSDFRRLPGAAILFLDVKNGKVVDTDQKWHDVSGALVGKQVK